MKIDLNTVIDELEINEIISFSKDELKNSGILKLEDVAVEGSIYYKYDNPFLDLNIKGLMVVPDSITLEEIELPFDINVEETINQDNENICEYLDNLQNTLDIKGVLWQNIVLEVPIRITNHEDHEKMSGDGWELLQTEEKRIDPRLAELNKLLDEGKE